MYQMLIMQARIVHSAIDTLLKWILYLLLSHDALFGMFASDISNVYVVSSGSYENKVFFEPVTYSFKDAAGHIPSVFWCVVFLLECHTYTTQFLHLITNI